MKIKRVETYEFSNKSLRKYLVDDADWTDNYDEIDEDDIKDLTEDFLDTMMYDKLEFIYEDDAYQTFCDMANEAMKTNPERLKELQEERENLIDQLRRVEQRIDILEQKDAE